MPSTRILLVDDEVSVLELIRTTLETCGYAIDTAASSQEAMEKVRHNEYGMLILDLLLPDMHGFLQSPASCRSSRCAGRVRRAATAPCSPAGTSSAPAPSSSGEASAPDS